METEVTVLLEADIEGHPISTHAMVIEEIGADEDGNQIEVLFEALVVGQWGIRLIPDQEKLGLSNYPEELVEF